jgi:hypothetical protein
MHAPLGNRTEWDKGFALFDTDVDGFITIKEFKGSLMTFGIIDTDGNDIITRVEYDAVTNSGECWISSYVDPGKAAIQTSDRLWLLKEVEHTSPRPNDPGPGVCVDKRIDNDKSSAESGKIGMWTDAFGRTCQVYREQQFCDAAGNNVIGHYGPAWDFLNTTGKGGTFFDMVKGTYGAASEACCGCGRPKTTFGFNIHVRRHGNITMYLKNVSALVCSPDLHNYINPSDSICGEPFEQMFEEIFFNGSNTRIRRCCIKPSASMPLTLDSASTELPEDSPTILDYSLKSNESWVVANGLNVRDISKVLGYKGEGIRLLSTDAPVLGGGGNKVGGILRPTVIGGIYRIEVKTRGYGYTDDTFPVILPVRRAEHHNWADGDATRQTLFKPALFSFAIGFPGGVEGTFDGSNIEYMCADAPPADRATCYSNPYGKGFGPCLTFSRARGALLGASTSVYDFANVTNLDTAGASSLVAFRIHGLQFLAVANYMNHSKIDFEGESSFPFSSPRWNQNIDHARRTNSQLFRLSTNSTGLLAAELVQEFETTSAIHVSYTLVQGQHILAFAQEVANVSLLYALPFSTPRDRLFHAKGDKFELIQNLTTHGARAMHALTASTANGGDTFFFVAQSQNAPDTLDLNGQQAQSMMMRWNGTQLQGTNTKHTLLADVAGSQAFVSHAATDFVPFRARDGTDHVVLLNFEESTICRDNPKANCTNSRCLSGKAYRCDQCPRTCGTCDMCSSALLDAEQGRVRDQPLANLALLGIENECSFFKKETSATVDDNGEPVPPVVECMQSIADSEKVPWLTSECMACPQTCGIAGCAEYFLNSSGGNYGASRTASSLVASARRSRVVGRKGPSSVVVSPDGFLQLW